MNQRDIKNFILPREEVLTDLESYSTYVKGKTVLVTGGGGSIGSELCRQLCLLGAKKLVILDIYENGAYEVFRELDNYKNQMEISVEIADITDKRKINALFKKIKPQVVFNASAHKHVPLMEDCPDEAVKNNVYGTLNLLKASGKNGVEVFVQISTDKAVNPSSIMGATKLLCEIMLKNFQKKSKVKFTAVRFGNVLGSNGSVIPIFEKQIEAGGPITLTHKEMVRYFMTVKEAVSLLITAGSLCVGGEVFVLDMGSPVKIYDLAKKMVELSNKDIAIVETGLRTGEKLYEECLYDSENLQATKHKKISVATLRDRRAFVFNLRLKRLIRLSKKGDDGVKQMIAKILPEYQNGQV
jgi:FlaA1/EpsC-like NDP-sugar epimerase